MVAQNAVRAGRAFLELLVDDSQFGPELAQAKRQVTDLGTALVTVGAIASAAGAAMVGGIVVALKSMSDLIEEANRLRQTFGENADAAQAFADNLSDSLGRSRQSIYQGLANFQANFVGAGASQEDARALSEALAELAVDFSSFNNISTAEAFQRFTQALSGSSEVLDSFGVNIRQASLDLQLAELGFKSVEGGATELQKRLARFEIIRNTLGRQGAIGDAERTFYALANQIRYTQKLLEDFAQAVGRALEPIAQTVLTVFNPIVKAVTRLVELFPNVTRGAALLAVGMAALGAATLAVAGAFKILAAALTATGIAALALNPYFLAVAITIGAVAAGIALLLDLLEDFSRFRPKLQVQTPDGLVDADSPLAQELENIKKLKDGEKDVESYRKTLDKLTAAERARQEDYVLSGRAQEEIREGEKKYREFAAAEDRIAEATAKANLKNHELRLKQQEIRHQREVQDALSQGQLLLPILIAQAQERTNLEREIAEERKKIEEEVHAAWLAKQREREELLVDAQSRLARASAASIEDPQQRERVELNLRQQEEIREAIEQGRSLLFIFAAQQIERSTLERRFAAERAEERRRERAAEVQALTDQQRRLAEVGIRLQTKGPDRQVAELLEKQRQEAEDALAAGQRLLDVLTRQNLERVELQRTLAEQAADLEKQQAEREISFPRGEGIFGGIRAELRLLGDTRGVEERQLDELRKIRREEEQTRQAILDLEGGIAGI